MLKLTSSPERVSSTPLQKGRWRMAIENRNLVVGTRLEANYKKTRYVCTVEISADGDRNEFVLEDGKRFKSPSSAGMAVMGGKAVNGWRFWSLADGEQPTPSESEAKPKSTRGKTKAVKLFKRLPPNGLEEGQHRIWCQACQKSFITTEADPEACPKGHRADDPELTG